MMVGHKFLKFRSLIAALYSRNMPKSAPKKLISAQYDDKMISYLPVFKVASVNTELLWLVRLRAQVSTPLAINWKNKVSKAHHEQATQCGCEQCPSNWGEDVSALYARTYTTAHWSVQLFVSQYVKIMHHMRVSVAKSRGLTCLQSYVGH